MKLIYHKVTVTMTPVYEEGELADAPTPGETCGPMTAGQDGGQPQQAGAEALFDGSLRERVRSAMLAPFKRFLVNGLVANGKAQEQAEAHVEAIGDGTLLKLIFENWDKILQLIMIFMGGL